MANEWRLELAQALTALLSGEMRDTAELGMVSKIMTDNLIPRPARAKVGGAPTACGVARTLAASYPAEPRLVAPFASRSVSNAWSSGVGQADMLLLSMLRFEDCIKPGPTNVQYSARCHAALSDMGQPDRDAAGRRAEGVGQRHVGAGRRRRHGGRQPELRVRSAEPSAEGDLLELRVAPAVDNFGREQVRGV